MDDISEAEKQRRQKYRDHDLVTEDLKPMDLETIRGGAIRGFVETRKSDNVELIVDSFMSFLTSRGYRIVKKETP